MPNDDHEKEENDENDDDDANRDASRLLCAIPGMPDAPARRRVVNDDDAAADATPLSLCPWRPATDGVFVRLVVVVVQ